jgi:hypothetical protein
MFHGTILMHVSTRTSLAPACGCGCRCNDAVKLALPSLAQGRTWRGLAQLRAAFEPPVLICHTKSQIRNFGWAPHFSYAAFSLSRLRQRPHWQHWLFTTHTSAPLMAWGPAADLVNIPPPTHRHKPCRCRCALQAARYCTLSSSRLKILLIVAS